MIGVAAGWFIYGAHGRGYRQLKHAEEWVRTRPGVSVDIQTVIAETKLMMAMRWAQVARWLRWSWLLRRLQRKYRPIYEAALEELEAGAWDRLQALQHNAERIGIARPDRLPLPARQGYGSLGLVSMDVIATRDALREKPWKLGPQKVAAALRCIEQAERYGWTHELWKFHWILFCRGEWRGRLTHLCRAWRPFWETQYSRTGRLFQLINNMLPH